MAELLYLASNDRYDSLIRDPNHFDAVTLRKVNNGNKLAIAKLLRFDDLSLLVQFVKHQFSTYPV